MDRHADDAAIATSRNRLNTELSLTSGERPDLVSEAQEELGNFHSKLFGEDKVAKLMEHDREQERDYES